MDLVVKEFNQLTAHELYDIMKARVDIFVVEQECPYPELDNKDQSATHVWLQDQDGIQAYLRVLPAGISFEEVALGRVIARKRRCGLATKLLEVGIQIAKEKYSADAIKIEAQVYAKSLYESVGFKQTSDEFLEDGIPHVEMVLNFKVS